MRKSEILAAIPFPRTFREELRDERVVATAVDAEAASVRLDTTTPTSSGDTDGFRIKRCK